MRGVFPGSFDPPTVAHVVIAEAAVHAAGSRTLDLAVSRTPLGKDANAASPVEARVAREIVAPEARRRVVVDAMNVIGSRPDGWWRDRDGAARRLVVAVQAFARRTGDRVAVVLDGRPIAGLPEGVHDGVLVAYARRGGRDAADDRIVEEVARDRDRASLVVVTSDHALRERVQALGARVEGAGAFLTALGSVRP